MATRTTENLVLCHGTRQPIGQIVELEARDNPNGEPLDILRETKGIWAADNEEQCFAYTTKASGFVVGRNERFNDGTEGQIYHFDLPNVKVETIRTKDYGLWQANDIVSHVLKNDPPDVLRLARDVGGVEYLILNPELINLVKITDPQGNELPPGPGMKLKQPSPEYCQSQVERYNSVLLSMKRVVSKVQELADVEELMQEFGEQAYGMSPQQIGSASSPESELRKNVGHTQTVTPTEYLLMLEQEHKTIEKMSFYLDRVKKEPFSVDNDEVISELSEWMDRYHRSTMIRPDMTVSATREWFNNASDGMEVIQRHLMIDTDSGMFSSDRELADAQKEHEYWQSRCETKRAVPHLDYCQTQSMRASEQVLSTERGLVEDKKQLTFYKDFNQEDYAIQASIREYAGLLNNVHSLEDLRTVLKIVNGPSPHTPVLQEFSPERVWDALELKRANPDASFTFEISDLESKVKLQEHALNVARTRFEYWQDECNRLREPKKITPKNAKASLNATAPPKRRRSKKIADGNTNAGEGKSMTVRISGKSS